MFIGTNAPGVMAHVLTVLPIQINSNIDFPYGNAITGL
jgi:hypothetical protein